MITNSGLMVAQAAGYTGIGISLPNGGHVINTATGMILAEGKTSVGVSIEINALDGKPELDNAGRIEAHGTAGTAGVGVLLGFARIANSGSILGEYGIAGSSGQITNSGTITGTLAALSFRGSVTLDNSGTIDGGVRLYDGNIIIVNTPGGRITGVIDLGLGNDTFIGGDGADRVAPDNGDDLLDGRGGNDLVLGGNGNDVLIGGAGNDGLYGENGADRFVTDGGDGVFGGRGDDRIELGDWTIARVDGGEGVDTLVLPGGGRVLDLSQVVGSGRVTAIEIIEMRGGQELVVPSADVATLAGGTLRVDATGGDRVDLVGGWVEGAATTIGGVSYTRYGLAGQAVLVRAGAAIGTAAPAGAVGLDAVPSGDAASAPGGSSGVELTPDTLFVQYLEIYEPAVIPDTDIWFTTGKTPALWSERDSAALTVQGLLVAESDAQATAIAADFRNGTRTVIGSTGEIYARSAGAIERPVPDYFPVNLEGAYAIKGGLSVNNGGLIHADADHGMAVAIGSVQITPASGLMLPATYFI